MQRVRRCDKKKAPGKFDVLHDDGTAGGFIDVLTAEASACVKALQAATDFGIYRIQLEMDFWILKQALLTPSLDLAASGMLIRDIRDLLHEHFICNDIILIPRPCNSVAHELARLGIS